MTKIKPKVLVGMSGGVDSTVTACMLQEQGYDVIGVHFRFWTDPTVFTDEEQQKFPQNKCCTLDGITRIRQITQRRGIPFYVFNFEEPFKKQVVDYFIKGYNDGITPNPCIECNREIKFGLFFEKMRELGADYIASGHYARKIVRKEGDKEYYELWMAADKTKDQSYFLYTLTQEKLRHTLFPLGEYTKLQVRELAKKYGVAEINDQKESQNLCFFPERQHGDFLKRYLEKQAFEPGPILTQTSEQIGIHQGLPYYTIGQRKGLGIGGIKGENEGQPWFVIQIDRSRNALIVGKNNDLFSTTLKATTLSFIDNAPLKNGQTLQAKIRYRFPLQPATLRYSSQNLTEKNSFQSDQLDEIEIEFTKPQRAITPGQSVVFYDREKVLGGGIIK